MRTSLSIVFLILCPVFAIICSLFVLWIFITTRVRCVNVAGVQVKRCDSALSWMRAQDVRGNITRRIYLITDMWKCVTVRLTHWRWQQHRTRAALRSKCRHSNYSYIGLLRLRFRGIGPNLISCTNIVKSKSKFSFKMTSNFLCFKYYKHPGKTLSSSATPVLPHFVIVTLHSASITTIA